jgi:hypothetical protein
MRLLPPCAMQRLLCVGSPMHKQRERKAQTTPYWVERERILAMVQRAFAQLEHLIGRPDHVEGSCPEQAFQPLEEAAGWLTPDEFDGSSNGTQHPDYRRREELRRAAHAEDVASLKGCAEARHKRPLRLVIDNTVLGQGDDRG